MGFLGWGHIFCTSFLTLGVEIATGCPCTTNITSINLSPCQTSPLSSQEGSLLWGPLDLTPYTCREWSDPSVHEGRQHCTPLDDTVLNEQVYDSATWGNRFINDAMDQSLHTQSYLQSLPLLSTVKKTKLKKYRMFPCHVENSSVQYFMPDHCHNLLVASSPCRYPCPVLPHHHRKVA